MGFCFIYLNFLENPVVDIRILLLFWTLEPLFFAASKQNFMSVLVSLCFLGLFFGGFSFFFRLFVCMFVVVVLLLLLLFFLVAENLIWIIMVLYETIFLFFIWTMATWHINIGPALSIREKILEGVSSIKTYLKLISIFGFRVYSQFLVLL